MEAGGFTDTIPGGSMSEQDSTTPEAPAVEADEQVTEETTDATQNAPEADADESTDWRKNFNPDIAAKRIEKLQSEAKNLRERAKQAEQKAQGADEKDTKITGLESEILRYKVGYELGLPEPLVARLKGATREELIEDAKALVELVGTPKAPATRKPVEALRGGARPEQEPDEKDVRRLAERMFSH